MQTTRCRVAGRTQVLRVAALAVALVTVITMAACGGRAPRASSSPAQRAESIRQIASAYAASGDLEEARAGLDKLGVPNPAKLALSVAEDSIGEGRPQEETEQLVALAQAVGASSPQLAAYKASMATPVPPAPATDVPARAAATPLLTLAPADTATAPPDTPTPRPPTVTPSAEPTTTPSATVNATASSIAAKPRVAASKTVNLRAGPSTQHPAVGQLEAGRELDIVGRNASGDWWQLQWPGPQQAWVAGTVVKVLGPIDLVAVAKNIPTPPPAPTRAPTSPAPPTAAAAPTAPPPPPGVVFRVASLRLRPIGQDGQQCNGGNHNIWAYVFDAAGNPLDNVRVRETFTGVIRLTGSDNKGPGAAVWDIYRGGGGQLEIVDDGNNRISEVSRGMSADFPDFDLMKAAGYCGCKPHPDDASCQADLANHTYLFATGHYVFEVVFRRTY